MRRPSAALVFACIGLFVSLGGAAMGATHYLITSKKQISPKMLHVLRGARGKRGPVGAAGPAGPSGAAGAAGAVKLIYVTASVNYPAEASSDTEGTLSCPSGSYALGASGTTTTRTQLSVAIAPDGFKFGAGSDTVDAGSATLYGVCASGPGLAATSQQGQVTNGPPPLAAQDEQLGSAAVVNEQLAKVVAQQDRR